MNILQNLADLFHKFLRDVNFVDYEFCDFICDD